MCNSQSKGGGIRNFIFEKLDACFFIIFVTYSSVYEKLRITSIYRSLLRSQDIKSNTYSKKTRKNRMIPLIKKQPPEVFFKKMCSKKFRKIHRQTPVNFAKFLRTPFLQNPSGRLLLQVVNLFQYYKKRKKVFEEKKLSQSTSIKIS